MDVGWAAPALWVSLGALVVIAGFRAGRHRAAYRLGIFAVSALWVVGGAAVNASFLARGDDYSGFADGASTSFVRDTWESLVVPHHLLFIGLLIAFEALAGVLVLVEGPIRQAALLALIAFNVLLLSFGWGYLVWSVPLSVALSLLWRAGRRDHGSTATPSHPTRRPEAVPR
jgi:hypothetical protein